MNILTSIDATHWLQDNSLREAECDEKWLLEVDELNHAIQNGGVTVEKEARK